MTYAKTIFLLVAGTVAQLNYAAAPKQAEAKAAAEIAVDAAPAALSPKSRAKKRYNDEFNFKAAGLAREFRRALPNNPVRGLTTFVVLAESSAQDLAHLQARLGQVTDYTPAAHESLVSKTTYALQIKALEDLAKPAPTEE